MGGRAEEGEREGKEMFLQETNAPIRPRGREIGREEGRREGGEGRE